MSEKRRRTSTPTFKPIGQRDQVQAAADLTRRKRKITVARSLRNGRIGGKQNITAEPTAGPSASLQEADPPQASSSHIDTDVQMLDSGVGPNLTPHRDSDSGETNANTEKVSKRKRANAAVSTISYVYDCVLDIDLVLPGPHPGVGSSTGGISGRDTPDRREARLRV